MERVKDKALWFYNGVYYPIFVALNVFIGHTFSIEAFSIILFIATLVPAFFVCDDLRFFISPLLTVTFVFSYKTFKSGWLSEPSFAILVVISAIAIIGSLIAHFVIKKRFSDIKSLVSSKLFWGFVAICVAFLLNGFFNFDEYKTINITFALLLCASFFIIYIIFTLGLKKSEGRLEYIVFVLYVASVVLLAEMAVLLLRDATFYPDGSIIKESLIVGWGAWNNMGCMLAMLLPIHFYYASVKKHGYIFYGTALLTYLAIVFTLSRSSLIVASIISAVCVVIICIKGQNVKINRIITGALLVVALIGVIVLWDKITTLLGSYLRQGLGDNGRFNLYKQGFESFLSHPIFGRGFGNTPEDGFGHGIEPNRYHNTIIQLLGTCGLVGLIAYAFHRYQTVKLLISKRSLISLFLGLVIAVLLMTSLLDNHIFNMYPAFYYTVILRAIEISSDKSTDAKKEA